MIPPERSMTLEESELPPTDPSAAWCRWDDRKTCGDGIAASPGILHYSQLMASAAHAANLAEAEMLDEAGRMG